MSNIAIDPMASESGASVATISSLGPPTSKENVSWLCKRGYFYISEQHELFDKGVIIKMYNTMVHCWYSLLSFKLHLQYSPYPCKAGDMLVINHEPLSMG